MLRDAAERSEEAWRRLVLRYSRPIYRWARSSGLQPADAANVTQDVLRSVVLNLGEFRRQRGVGSFRAWLRTITRNKVLDLFRQRQRSPEHALGGDDGARMLQDCEAAQAPVDPSLTALPPMRSELRAVIEAVRDQVSPRDWAVFWRTAVDGQPAAEAADEHGMTSNAVRLVKMRVLRRLRAAIADASRPDVGPHAAESSA